MIDLEAGAEGVLRLISPVEAVAGIKTEGFEILIFDGAGGSVRNGAEGAAGGALAVAEVGVVRPPRGGGDKGVGSRLDFVGHGNGLAIK